MKQLLGMGAVLAGILVLAPPTSTAHALDCDTNLVVRGDRDVAVLAACGEPASRHTRTEVRSVFVRWPAPGAVQMVTVTVEVWVYDFGPQRFMEELTFENGVLVALRPVGQGRRRSPTRHRLD